MSFDKGREAKAEIETAEAKKAEMSVMEQFLELQTRMLALQEQNAAQAKLQATALATQVERTAPRENPNYITRSLFAQENGEPWAKTLKCEVFFGPYPLHETPLTQKEVIALNRLQPLAKGTIEKTDLSIVQASVTPKYDAQDRLTTLTISVPLAKDSNPQHYPPLEKMALQLVEQIEAQMSAVA